MPEKYKDMDGNPVSLDRLCREEPAWAANRIRDLEEKIRALLHDLVDARDCMAEVKKSVSEYIEELNEEIKFWKESLDGT